MSGDSKAAIFDIQRFSLHDGPGIRTVVFFYGCRMRCAWCQNPESFSRSPEAIARLRYLSEAELYNELLRDHAYFGQDGGVTLSGGEATMHHRFLLPLVRRLRGNDISIVLETAGFFQFDVVRSLLDTMTLIYYDLKSIDDTIHRTFTKRSNSVILENAKRLIDEGLNVEFRIPVVPKVNDNIESIREFAQFLRGLGRTSVHLLRYHNLYQSKLGWLGIADQLPTFTPHTDQEFDKIKQAFEQAGISVCN